MLYYCMYTKFFFGTYVLLLLKWFKCKSGPSLRKTKDDMKNGYLIFFLLLNFIFNILNFVLVYVKKIFNIGQNIYVNSVTTGLMNAHLFNLKKKKKNHDFEIQSITLITGTVLSTPN